VRGDGSGWRWKVEAHPFGLWGRMRPENRERGDRAARRLAARTRAGRFSLVWNMKAFWAVISLYTVRLAARSGPSAPRVPAGIPCGFQGGLTMKRRLFYAISCSLILAAGAAGIPRAAAQTGERGNLLTVDDCVKMALENNRTVAIAGTNVSSSRAAAMRAWSRVLPNVSANTYWDRLTQGPTEQLTLNERTGEIIVAQTESQAFVSYTMGLTATQTLFDWSALEDISAARANVSAARYSKRATEQDIVFQVKQQFYNLVKAEKLLEVSQKSHERSLKQLERARSLYDLGSVARSDVLKAKVDAAQTELDLIAARNAVALEKARLAKLMGLPVDERIEVEADLTVTEQEVDPNELFAMARSNRPDLRAASERVRAAQAGLHSARAGQYPSLFSYFNWRWRDDVFPTSTGDLERKYTWTVGMGIQFPIFDGMLTRGNVGEARAGLEARLKEYEDLELSVALEIKEALLSLQEARQRLVVSEEQLASAEESYKLAREQYEVGLGTILELTDASVELTTAESQRVQAITDYKVALALIDKATGRGLD